MSGCVDEREIPWSRIGELAAGPSLTSQVKTESTEDLAQDDLICRYTFVNNNLLENGLCGPRVCIPEEPRKFSLNNGNDLRQRSIDILIQVELNRPLCPGSTGYRSGIE